MRFILRNRYVGLYLIKSSEAARHIGVEVVSEAVENVLINAVQNGIANAEFICADADGIISGADGQNINGNRESMLNMLSKNDA